MNHSLKRTLVVVVGVLGLAMPAFADHHGGKYAKKNGVSGYADAQYQYTNGGGHTFAFDEGAVYWGVDKDHDSGMIDIGVAAGVGAVGVNQAFYKHAYDGGVRWQLGKFDRFYGFEANDSVDLTFSNQSAVTGLHTGSHTGLLAGYAGDGWSVDILAANPLGAATMGGANPDLGANLSFDVGDWMLGAGVIYNKVGTGSTTSADVTFGGKAGDAGIDLEFAWYKPVAGDSTIAALGQVTYPAMDKWMVGARAGFINKPAAGVDNVIEFTPGAQMDCSEHLKGKIDYTLTLTSPTIGDSIKSHAVSIGGVVKL